MPPAIISARPAKTTRWLPKRCPSRPPGSAKTTPGSMKRPMSSPTCAQEMSKAVTRNGVSAAMDWNWKPSDVRVKKITSSIAQRWLMRRARGRPARTCRGRRDSRGFAPPRSGRRP